MEQEDLEEQEGAAFAVLAEVRPEDEAVSVIEVEAEGEELQEEALALVEVDHGALLAEALGVGDSADYVA